jgi:hypothetical protein
MSERQRRLLGILLLVVGIGVGSLQALLVSCHSPATAAYANTIVIPVELR